MFINMDIFRGFILFPDLINYVYQFSGDQFRMQSTDLYCRLHYDIIENFSTSDEHPGRIEDSSPPNKSSPPTNNKRGRPPKRKLLSGLQDNLKDADRSLDYFHPTNGKPPSNNTIF